MYIKRNREKKRGRRVRKRGERRSGFLSSCAHIERESDREGEGEEERECVFLSLCIYIE